MEHPLYRDAGQPAGALGLGQAMATRVYCAFYLFYYAAPIFVAVVADSYLGRYATLVASVVLYCLGCAILTASSIPSIIEKGWGLWWLWFLSALEGEVFEQLRSRSSQTNKPRQSPGSGRSGQEKKS
jgi:POT family proton-dependent oligopeptide transporter